MTYFCAAGTAAGILTLSKLLQCSSAADAVLILLDSHCFTTLAQMTKYMSLKIVAYSVLLQPGRQGLEQYLCTYSLFTGQSKMKLNLGNTLVRPALGN